MRSTRNTGFTLIELMVAMAIFSFLATAMYTGIRQIISEREILLQQTDELNQLQRAVRYLNTDFSQLHPRDIRGPLGQDRIGALSSDPSQDFTLELSRNGWRNPAQAVRGSLQRVRYRLEDEVLIREYWPVMDHLLGADTRQLELLKGVEKIEIAYLDDQLEWQADWPPATNNSITPSTTILPLAIRYKLTLKSFGEIERLVEIIQ
ncbi:MAG: type II secretion system minor pseudopilin GspJ [Gammaproteobacteria bacterium]|nr:type II secretion system minor pseudopilin GspJ [Gammaproteobacteria bacterium]MCP4090498.1 type II secretion system minor pseudopilin GspJ [Gammaproteobacteria bacterium]MCP4276637.1 type II secretion system minor pseudopilin GspJ [Gammaproteobacteria bacterium]MCP4831387.1 type II secretion system minor pseudopilin GspJ [Gammaproteobacteria bacterium]MCP4927931.1 type II secretion system minor pseudopilin GspJ [Gammaproteobacteria bacterium]